MSVSDRIYQPFWAEFQHSDLGPASFCASDIRIKNRNEGYREFPERYQLGFRPVATLSAQKDRLSVELFSGSSPAREFLNDHWRNLSPIRIGDHTARYHINDGTDCKIEFVWPSASIENQDLWPAHFLWIRLGIDLLVKTYRPHIAQFAKDHGHV